MPETEPERLILGEALPLDLDATASGGATPPDFAFTPVTVVLDHFPPPPANPPATPTARRVLRWRPGGASAPEFSLAGSTLRLTLPGPWTAANLSGGRWRVYWCVGPPAIQDAVKVQTLFVEVPPGGALPTEDPA